MRLTPMGRVEDPNFAAAAVLGSGQATIIVVVHSLLRAADAGCRPQGQRLK